MPKTIESPCISVCKLSEDLCIGCGRTLEEIRRWKTMQHLEKSLTVKRAEQRLKHITKID
ncbi:DUF1289 domain-containing protein [Vreelandella rituensis]|uniref:DUF1289 domain-containing protein n=1 Tax=Vreelandella rituensis TaxID=2282306 RepID=A0A368TV06_9GAMM|nr:DUF1289 domain-containing protein [Halomonas rituensis]RCV88097.1 DUF1289 domain-containing protein [Halomonas rituensis]